MPLILSIVATILLRQVEPGTAGMEPYVFVERGEAAARLYVMVQLEDLGPSPNPFVDAILDEPWLPIEQRGLKLRRSDYVDFYPQVSSIRNRRVAKGWLAHEGVEVDTPEGRIWVHKVEYDLAQRADEMADAVRRGDAAAPVPAGPPTEDTAREPLGFWAEWRNHIGILGGAVVLIALVIWATLVRGPWTPLRP